MSVNGLIYMVDYATSRDIMGHLIRCNTLFHPPLEQTVDIGLYASKIANLAKTMEAWYKNELVGLIAVYSNDLISRHAFITNVSVEEQFIGMGVASRLLEMCIHHMKVADFSRIDLEVDERNEKARYLYQKYGFKEMRTNNRVIIMRYNIDAETKL